MHGEVIFFLGINYLNGFLVADQYPLVSYLPAAFSIKRSRRQHQLELPALGFLYLTVTGDAGRTLKDVIPHKSLPSLLMQGDPVPPLLPCSRAGTGFLLLHLCIKTTDIHRKTTFPCDQGCQVQGKAVRII